VVVAQVGDATLTLEDLLEYVPEEVLERASRSELLGYANQWIRSELIYQRAVSMGYARDARVRERLREVERDIIVNTFLEDELDMGPFIAETEISAYHANNEEAFRREEEEIQLSLLWFSTQGSAEQGRAAIASGATFQQVASDTGYHVTSADLDPHYLSRENMSAGLAAAAFRQQTGTLSRPTEVNGMYAVLQVNDRKEAGTVRALWEVKDDIQARLASDLREMTLETLLMELLDRSEVSVNVDAAFAALQNRERP
jgi:parvulin-like peptidyl-prolyl isomerase